MTDQMNQKITQHRLLWILIFILCFPSPSLGNGSSETIGDTVQIILPTIAYGMTFVKKDSEGRPQFYKAFFSNIGITHALKRITSRTRPNGSDYAFPAGHVSAAFSSAAFLEKRYGWRYGLPAYIGAAYVGWSRIDSDEHFPEDVWAGAALGVITSYFFTQPLDQVKVHLAGERGGVRFMIQGRW